MKESAWAAMWRSMCRIFAEEMLAAWDRRQQPKLETEETDEQLEKSLKNSGMLNVPFGRVDMR